MILLFLMPKTIIPRMSKLIAWELGYLAGMLDGDGCISMCFHKRNKAFVPSVTIVNTDETLIDWIVSKIDGTKGKSKTKYKNRTCHLFRWEIHSKKGIQAFLEPLKDMLIVKKEQAIVMLDWIDGKIESNDAQVLLRELKTRRKISLYN